MKKILLLLFFGIIFFGTYRTARAQDNFSTSYDVSYNVSEDQNTKVELNVALRNNTSGYYASSYTIQTGFKKIANIIATDENGSLKSTTKVDNNGTSISLTFNKNVVGINNTKKFKVIFDTQEIAKNSGSVWEINIPGVSDQANFSSFNAEITVPQSFGQPSIIKPQVKNLKSSNNSLFFSKEDLGESGISIAYGSAQSYDFDLKYHLYNKNLFPVETEIALPSNNNYQEVRINDINPAPLNVYIDKDGNWLAQYKLSPSKNVDISVKGSGKVSYKPRRETLSSAQRNLYLSPQKYWETGDPDIKSLAKELKTPQAIYQYVVKNLKYDPTRVKDVQKRAGAEGVLKDKNSAVCLEFTDLFIALSRAAGIPAREVEGFANTDNSAQRPLSLLKDVLHSWPEYYDDSKDAWIMVDPTWENTTGGIDYFNVFDFDHLAFAIKGEQSDYPVPAGGYKIPGNENVRDVEVTTSKSFEKKLPVLTASTNFSQNYLAGFPISGEIVVTNLSGVLAPNQTFNVSSVALFPNSQNLFFDRIPPYGKKSIPVKFKSRPFLTNEADIIKITIGPETIDRQIIISPAYKNFSFIIFLGGLLIGSIIVIVSIAAYKRRRLSIS